MSYKVRYTRVAREDLKRLYAFLVEHDQAAASRALEAIRKASELLSSFPFTCRKADDANPLLRELVVSFGDSGYVALFEIESNANKAAPTDPITRYVTILAVRHQREDDFY